MRKRYGDPHKILMVYRQEIKEWSQLKPEDAAAYRKFFNCLIKWETLEDERNWNALNSPELLCTLISKLNTSENNGSWNRKVQSIPKQHKKELDFQIRLGLLMKKLNY